MEQAHGADGGVSAIVRHALSAWLEQRRPPTARTVTPPPEPAPKRRGPVTLTATLKPASTRKQPPKPSKVMRVKLWLRVERNNSYVRGMKPAREKIENWILRRFNMQKPDKNGWEYVLTIPYDTDEELNDIIEDEILSEAERMADLHNCFIEANVTSLDEPDRYW